MSTSTNPSASPDPTVTPDLPTDSDFAPRSFYPITGIQDGLGPDGKVPLRREVDEWYNDPDTIYERSLFFRALEKFQQKDITDKFSYYQIAGIHWQPLVPWDEDTKPQTEGVGYCTHNNILFACWHRPYLALFEQLLHEIMVNYIIPWYTKDQDKYRQAAKSWRLPYWDWAQKKPRGYDHFQYRVPDLLLREWVTVFGKAGVQTQMRNPMLQFKTPKPMGDPSYGKNGLTPIDDQFDGKDRTYPYDLCYGTSRGIRDFTALKADQWAQGVNGPQNNKYIHEQFDKHEWYQTKLDGSHYSGTIGDAVYRLFSEKYFNDYDAFSSTCYKERAHLAEFLSCEGVHNNIHNWIGGDGGYMAEPAVSAFDPIFWLHHCNVDRQFAIWQALHPDAWFSDKSQQVPGDGTWSMPSGTAPTPSTALAPFHNKKGEYHTSDAVRNWLDFGYSYPELRPWLPQYRDNMGQYRADIARRVNQLYGSGRDMVLRTNHSMAASVTHYDYVVNVLYEKFALGGSSFTITIYLGDGTDSSVGSVYNFSTPAKQAGMAHGCANCIRQEQSGSLATGQVPITTVLLRDMIDTNKDLSSLDEDEVAAYLKRHLRWDVRLNSGKEVPLRAIPSLQVMVATGTGTHHRHDGKLSTFQDYRLLEHVTAGVPGGYIGLPGQTTE